MLVLATGCVSRSDHDALVVRVATIEAELAAQERQAERLADLEERLPPTTTVPSQGDDSACDAAKRQWRNLQPRVLSWFQANEPELFEAWIAEPPGTVDDLRLWEALAAAMPDDLTAENLRISTDGQLHCGFDAFNDYIDYGYNTGRYPD